MSIFLSKIGIGTVQFGAKYGISNNIGQTSEAEVCNILEYCKEKSIKYIDTAFAYGNAEVILGKIDLSSFSIVSKYIPDSQFSLRSQLKQSLENLKISSLYGYLAHRPLDVLKNQNKNWNILTEFKEKGIVKKIGVSLNDTQEVELLLAEDLDIDIIQVPYNILDKRFEPYMQLLKDRGCEIHTRSTFLQGLFFCDLATLPTFFDEVKPFLRELQLVDNLAVKLFKYVLEKPFVDVVNIGVNNLNQLKSNIENIEKIMSVLPDFDFNVSNMILKPSEWPKFS